LTLRHELQVGAREDLVLRRLHCLQRAGSAVEMLRARARGERRDGLGTAREEGVELLQQDAVRTHRRRALAASGEREAQGEHRGYATHDPSMSIVDA